MAALLQGAVGRHIASSSARHVVTAARFPAAPGGLKVATVVPSRRWAVGTTASTQRRPQRARRASGSGAVRVDPNSPRAAINVGGGGSMEGESEVIAEGRGDMFSARPRRDRRASGCGEVGPRSARTRAAINVGGGGMEGGEMSASLAAGLDLFAAKQIVQLVASVGTLILLPAWVFAGRVGARPAEVFLVYLLFFGAGTVRRMLNHGRQAAYASIRRGGKWDKRAMVLFVVRTLNPTLWWYAIAWWRRFAKKRQDTQRQKVSAGALVMFILSMPALHWLAVRDWAAWDAARAGALAALPAWVPAQWGAWVAGAGATWAGVALMALGVLSNTCAVASLGAAWDRIATPDALVTSGPYRWVRHPIYTSYMLLFVGCGLFLGSPRAAAALLAVCLWYYRQRTGLEDRVLEEAFGQEFLEYKERTNAYLPRLLPRRG